MTGKTRVVRQGWLAVATGLLAAGSATAGVIRHDRSDATYRSLAAQNEFDPVGRFTWNEPGGSFSGSGVLISDEWVLTAGHVVGGTDNLGAGISNLQFQTEGLTRTAADWVPHPNWAATGGNLFAGWDLGLVRLAQPITSVSPATLYMGNDELGSTATLVGFGATGTGLTGATQSAGTKRAGQNVVDVVGGTQSPGSNPNFRFSHDRLIAVDFDQPGVAGQSTLGATAPLDLEYLTAPGDSGGGLFIEEDGQLVVAGITSLGSSNDGDGANSDYGDRASFTRVSSFIDWIESTTGLYLTSSSPIALPGDFNGDGVINAVDYSVWRNQEGLSITRFAGADHDGSGRIDQGDYDLWAAGFGSTLGGGPVSIPEPSSLVSLSLACLFGRRRNG